ncbi:MAG TPA: ABC transporter permease [Vicinamibacterales bacterium]|nr:ABC transporter permease [Vicinamibacterales bacterium]
MAPPRFPTRGIGALLGSGLPLKMLSHDVRHAIRDLIRAPRFALVVILAFAIGMAATTVMFSVAYGVLWRPLPYRDATRLVLVQREQQLAGAHQPIPALFFTGDDMAAWQRLHSFASGAFYSTDVVALATGDGPEVLDSAIVSGSFFATIDGPLAAGRTLGSTDAASPVVVISERLARRRFSSPAAAIGGSLDLSSRAYQVIGVTAADFRFPAATTDVWMPAGFAQTVNTRCCGLSLVARLKDDAGIAAARDEAVTMARLSRSGSPAGLLVHVVGLQDALVGASRPALLMLLSAAGLLLVVTCLNVMALLSARRVGRARQAALRLALGASRAQLVRHSLAEAAALATCGALAGLGVAVLAVRALKVWNPPGIPRLDAVHVDVPVLIFSAVIVVIAACATGVLPPLQHADVMLALRAPAETASPTRTGRRKYDVLCGAQLGVSLVLLVGALMLGRSLFRLLGTDIGVHGARVVTASLDLAFGAHPTDAQVLQRVDAIHNRLAALPGVQAAAVGTSLPPASSRIRLTLKRAGDEVDYQASGVAVTPDFFRAFGIRFIRGRLFTASDDLQHPQVMIMSRDTARRFFGDRDPIGQTMRLPVVRDGVQGVETMTLVGIIDNVKYSGLGAAADDAVYRPFTQQPWNSAYVVVRTAGDPTPFVETLRREIHDVDPGVVVSQVRTLDSVVSDAAAQPRFRTELLVGIAGLALTLALIGLYGVVTYSVSQRRRDIAVRVALGATRQNIVRMILRQGLVVATAGAAAGVAVALALSRLLSGLLYGVAPTDPVSFAGAVILLLGVSLVATAIPAWMAARVDTVGALRS